MIKKLGGRNVVILAWNWFIVMWNWLTDGNLSIDLNSQHGSIEMIQPNTQRWIPPPLLPTPHSNTHLKELKNKRPCWEMNLCCGHRSYLIILGVRTDEGINQYYRYSTQTSNITISNIWHFSSNSGSSTGMDFPSSCSNVPFFTLTTWRPHSLMW